MTEFLRDIEEFFDIFCNDQNQRRKLEEINKLKINEDDFIHSFIHSFFIHDHHHYTRH